MPKLLVFCGCLLLMTPPASRAALHLAVSDCGGGHIANWTCTSNTGQAFAAVASVDAPMLTTLVGEASVVEVAFENPVPTWWQAGSGYCRAGTSISIGFGGGAFSCFAYFNSVSSSVGGHSLMVGPDPAPGDPEGPIDAHHVRMFISSTVDSESAGIALQPELGEEIFLFSISVNRSRSIGAGSCSGCGESACMVLKRVTLRQPLGAPGGDPVIGVPEDHDYISLQGGVGADCPLATPSSRGSWGLIKLLYR